MNFPSSVTNTHHASLKDLLDLSRKALALSQKESALRLFLAVLLLLPLSHGHSLLFELPEAPGSQALRIGKPGEPEISALNIMVWISAGHSGSLLLWVDWLLASYFGYRDSDPAGQKGRLTLVSALTTPKAGSVGAGFLGGIH